MTLLLALGVLMNAGLGVFAWIHPRRSIDTFEVVGASIFLGSIFIFQPRSLLSDRTFKVAFSPGASHRSRCCWEPAESCGCGMQNGKNSQPVGRSP